MASQDTFSGPTIRLLLEKNTAGVSRSDSLVRFGTVTRSISSSVLPEVVRHPVDPLGDLVNGAGDRFPLMGKRAFPGCEAASGGYRSHSNAASAL